MNTSNTEQDQKNTSSKALPDRFEAPDFYHVDDLLSEEQKMIRGAIRDFVKKRDNTLH